MIELCQKKKNINRSHSVIRAVSGLILLIAAVLVVNMLLGVLSVLDLRSHNQKLIERTLSEYYSQQETRFNSVRHYVEWTAVNEPLLENLRQNTDEATISKNLTDLRSRIRDMQYSFGGGFMFYVCMDNGSRFYNLSDLTVTYSDYQVLRDFIIQEATDPSRKALQWQVFQDDPDHCPYLYYGVRYDQVYVVSVIQTDALKGSLDTLSLGRQGYYRLLSDDSTLLLESMGTGGSVISQFYRDFGMQSKREGLPYNIQIHADVYSSIAEQQIRQLMILFALLVLLAVAVQMVYRVNRSILQPLERFEQALLLADSEDSLLSLEDSSVKELAAAGHQLKTLVTELQNMRISMYEEELEKRKFEVTFLQHQIRPHFYLNCLSTIDSMAQLGETEEMRQMILFTSRYLRYLFQTGHDFVRLQYELSHVEAYLNIQNLRMGHTFTYRQSCDDDALEASIPPLFLITFVENSVKHAIPGDGEELVIQVTCRHEGEHLHITIEDSGHGFPAEWLECGVTPQGTILPSIDNGKTEDSENHIGIRNSIRRLSLIYGENFSLQLSNRPAPDHGACVNIQIPWKRIEPRRDMLKRTEL